MNTKKLNSITNLMNYNLVQPANKNTSTVVVNEATTTASCSKITKSNTICKQQAKDCITNHYKQNPPRIFGVGCSGCSGCTAKQCLC